MARMHSRKKGKSSSKHPSTKSVPPWVQQTDKEVTELVIELAKEGKPASDIGRILRDQHGIPSVKLIAGKSIKQILEENKLNPPYPEDFLNLVTKAVKLRKHLAGNKKDIHNRTILGHIESKIRRLTKYYKNEGTLPKTFYYKPEEAALLIKE